MTIATCTTISVTRLEIPAPRDSSVMYGLIVTSVLAALTAASAPVRGPQQRPPDAETRVKIGAPSMLRLATNPKLPEYPPASLKAKSAGVVVVELFASAAGQAEQVQVIEAPDQAIADATQRA